MSILHQNVCAVISLVRETKCLPLSVLTAFNVHDSYSVSMLATLYRLSGESSMHALLHTD